MDKKQITENFKSSNGITLITLAVTIIVIVILAGVTINSLVGENGIITKTQEARDKYAEC